MRHCVRNPFDFPSHIVFSPPVVGRPGPAHPAPCISLSERIPLALCPTGRRQTQTCAGGDPRSFFDVAPWAFLSLPAFRDRHAPPSCPGRRAIDPVCRNRPIPARIQLPDCWSGPAPGPRDIRTPHRMQPWVAAANSTCFWCGSVRPSCGP